MKIAGMCVSLIAMLLFTVSSYAGVIGSWPFNGDATDASGNGIDGVVVGGVEWVDGQFGQAISLNGTDAWVEVPELGSFDQVTIAEWARCTGKVGAWRSIFCNDGWDAGFVHHQLYAENIIGFSLHSNPGGNDSKSAFTFDDSQLDVWHHIATVYNGNEGWIRFYVDGELDIENAWGGNPAVLGPGRIGSWGGGGREWQGDFDEFVIYDTALSQADVQGLMSGGSTSVEPTGKLAISWGSIKE